MRNKKLLTLSCVAMLLLSACASGSSETGSSSSTGTATAVTKGQQVDYTNAANISVVSTEVITTDVAEESRVDITGDFLINTDVVDGYTVSGNTYTITKGGEYLLSGVLSGNIIVNVPEDEKVELMLAGVSITSENASAIYVSEAKSVTVTAKGGTFNEIIDSRATLSDSTDTTDESDDSSANTAKAAIYSCADLELKGQGTLIVTGNYRNGIQTKKDLEVKNITLKCTAANNSLKGKNSVTIESGEINLIASSGHGIKTSNNEVSDKGNQKGIITISGGNVTISAGKDGMNAVYDINISGDTNLVISAGDDGIHADETVTIDDGKINITKSYEGIEGHYVTVNGGSTYVYASDDGLNASGSSSEDTSQTTGRGGRGGWGGGGGMSFEATDACITVTGGYLDVTTPSGDTDAIDSNGNYVQVGGYVLVKGGASTGSVAGSIDVNGSIKITGGACVALGGICETPEESCNSYIMNGTSFAAGSYVLADSDGNEVLAFSLSTTYSNGWICSELLTEGTTFTLKKDDTEMTTWTQESGNQSNGGSNGGNNWGGGGGFPGGGQKPNGNFDFGGQTPPDGTMPNGEEFDFDGTLPDGGSFDFGGQTPPDGGNFNFDRGDKPDRGNFDFGGNQDSGNGSNAV